MFSVLKILNTEISNSLIFFNLRYVIKLKIIDNKKTQTFEKSKIPLKMSLQKHFV